MTLVALLVSTASVAQIPTLPWNPDENGDQFVGLPDLLGLLTVYGQEFENAIVAEDGESAIMYMGDMAYPLCAQACENLPGIWQLPRLEDLGLVWDDVHPTTVSAVIQTWVIGKNIPDYASPYYRGSTYSNGDTYESFVQSGGPFQSNRCYCTAKQLPRVEYELCSGGSGFVSCCQDLVSQGWYPLNSNPFSGGGNGSLSQAFWRFAQ